jgi:chromosome partitioning protein
MNPKGGVGKTTTAVNLAACCAIAGRKVTLLDLDARADAARSLGCEATPAAARFLLDEGAPWPEPLATSVPLLTVLAPGEGLLAADALPNPTESVPRALARALPSLAEGRDLLVLDVPPGHGPLHRGAILASHAAVIPVRLEPFALSGLQNALEVVRRAKKESGVKIAVAGICLTFVDDQSPLCLEAEAQLRASFGDQVFQAVIPEDRALVEASAFGAPVLQRKPSARGAWAYVELAKEVETHERTRTEPR